MRNIKVVGLVLAATMLAACGGGEDAVIELPTGENLAPSLASIPDITTSRNKTNTVTVVATDPESQALTITAVSSNASIASVSNLGGGVWQLQTHGVLGTATVTVTADDGTNETTDTFDVIVGNAAPTITAPADQEAEEDFASYDVSASGSDDDGDTITYSVSTQNNLLTASIDNTGKVTLASKSALYGVETVTVTADDGEAQTSDTFQVNVINMIEVSFGVDVQQEMIAGADSRAGWTSSLGFGTTMYEPIVKVKLAGKPDKWVTAKHAENSLAIGRLRAGTTYTVEYYAATGMDVENPTCMVVDNTTGGAVYTFQDTLTTGQSNQSVYKFIPTNFDGEAGVYTGPRTGTPFTLCATVLYGIGDLFLAGGYPITLPAIVINWSEDNIPTEGDVALGEIGTTYYSHGEIFILGAMDVDTDEFDKSVLVHEFTHFLEDFYGRSDSAGGDHGAGDILDPRVAWSEGMANAIAAKAAFYNTYSDNYGYQMSEMSLVDYDADNFDDADTHPTYGVLYDGSYSEQTVAEVMTDLMDGNKGNDDTDATALHLMDKVLAVFFEDLKSADGFATLPTVLALLTERYPETAVDVTAVAAAENIGAFDLWEDANTPLYTDLSVGGTVSLNFAGDVLSTLEDFGPITATNWGNRLYNQAFLRSTFAGNDTTCYALHVTPQDGQDLYVSTYMGIGVDDNGAGAAETFYFRPTGTGMAFDVGNVGGAGRFSASLDVAASSSLCNA